MNEVIEVELKFQILDEIQVREFIKNLKFISRRKIVDKYLDTKNADLYKKGLFIRIRDDNNMDFKYNLEDTECKHEHCEEHSFSLPLTIDSLVSINKICRVLSLNNIMNPNIEEFMTRNNLIVSITNDKIREVYRDEKFEFCLDDVKGLGKFIEIEMHAAKEDDLEKIKDAMRERIRGLKIKLVTTGYNELYWKKNNSDIYRQGKYHLEEDKTNQP
jgi:predicted adenylyl cyclase CyaB